MVMMDTIKNYQEKNNYTQSISNVVQRETKEKNSFDRKLQAYTKLLNLNHELHLSSNGRKWTREELYER